MTPTDDRRVTVLHEGDAIAAVADVVAAVAVAGLDVATLAIKDDLDFMVSGLRAKPPDLVVNLVQRFAGNPKLAPDVAAALELMRIPYTGASAAGLYLEGDADLAGRLLAAHGVPVVPPDVPADLIVAAIGNERPTVLLQDMRHRDAVTAVAAGAWSALRLRDYALLRVRLGKRPALVSATPNPSLGRGDPFARLCDAAGLRYEPLIAWILDEAWERQLTAEPAVKTA